MYHSCVLCTGQAAADAQKAYEAKMGSAAKKLLDEAYLIDEVRLEKCMDACPSVKDMIEVGEKSGIITIDFFFFFA
jgi:hypothetical protein